MLDNIHQTSIFTYLIDPVEQSNWQTVSVIFNSEPALLHDSLNLVKSIDAHCINVKSLK